MKLSLSSGSPVNQGTITYKLNETSVMTELMICGNTGLNVTTFVTNCSGLLLKAISISTTGLLYLGRYNCTVAFSLECGHLLVFCFLTVLIVLLVASSPGSKYERYFLINCLYSFKTYLNKNKLVLPYSYN